MSHPPVTAQERYAAIVAALSDNPAVTYSADDPQRKKSFGATELKVHGKIFAMLVRGNLVVKLPKPRVDALVVATMGERFDPRHDGRLMKEWLSIYPTFAEQWLPLTEEALAFVAAKR